MNQPSLSAKRQGIKKYRYNANKTQKKLDERYIRHKDFKNVCGEIIDVIKLKINYHQYILY